MRKLTHDEISVNRIKSEEIEKAIRMPVQVVLNSIRSSYNVGSVFRTSDGAMIEKLLLCGYTPFPPNKEVLKTSLGAENTIPWEYHKDGATEISRLKANGWKIAALEQTSNSRDYSELTKYDFPLVLIVGNEITGVSQDLIDLCDFSLEIPQYGMKQSLNVAVAYGIAIFEIRRNFEKTKETNKV